MFLQWNVFYPPEKRINNRYEYRKKDSFGNIEEFLTRFWSQTFDFDTNFFSFKP